MCSPGGKEELTAKVNATGERVLWNLDLAFVGKNYKVILTS